MNVLIVESPGKVKAINKYLGSNYKVLASFGHIRMDFALGTSVHGLPGGLMHALVILSLTVLPYLIWRLQKARSLSA